MKRSLAVLAGCASAPTADPAPTGTTAHADVSSDYDRPLVITVTATPPNNAGFAVEFVNGSVREYPNAADVAGIPDAVVPRAVSIRPIGEGVETRIYRITGGFSKTAVVENIQPESVVFVSVAAQSGEAPLKTTGSLTCGSDATLTNVTVRVNADGSVALGNNCRV